MIIIIDILLNTNHNCTISLLKRLFDFLDNQQNTKMASAANYVPPPWGGGIGGDLILFGCVLVIPYYFSRKKGYINSVPKAVCRPSVLQSVLTFVLFCLI